MSTKKPTIAERAQEAEQKGNRKSRDLWERFRDHRQRVTAEILALAPAANDARGGRLCVLGAGNAVRLRGGDESARLLLLAGVPLGEPVARYGPFVMNTERELMQAFQDYQSGKMGEITRTAQVG